MWYVSKHCLATRKFNQRQVNVGESIYLLLIYKKTKNV